MHKKLAIFILLFLATVISSCGGKPSATATSELVVIPTSLSPTELPQPTDIPPASRVLVSSGGGLGEVETQHIFSIVESLATTSGLSVEYIPVPIPELLTSDVKIVVVLPPRSWFFRPGSPVSRNPLYLSRSTRCSARRQCIFSRR